MGKKVQRLKRKNADLKKKLLQMAHTASEGKAMVCIKCKGQMIVWEKDKLKHQKGFIVRYATKWAKCCEKVS